MLSIPVYNKTGEKVGEESIDPADFGGTVNKQLLHDVVVMHLANRRVGTVNTRGRADVAGSGKKLFRQKGTGNARAGSKRTNKRKGGGVAFARRNRDYSYTMPKKAVRTAIRMAILSKFQDGQALIIDGLAATAGDAKPKTKVVAQVLQGRSSGPTSPRPRPTPGPDETKAAARERTLDGRTILIGTPALDPTLHQQRPQHRGRPGRAGGRVQHLRRPQAALPRPDPRGARGPQGPGQGEGRPPTRPGRRVPRREGELSRRWSPSATPRPTSDPGRSSSPTRSSSAP